MVFKNLLPCHGKYSCHRQGCTWQTKQHFQTCPSTISRGQPLGISKRMRIMLPWQNCFTAPSAEAFYQETSTWQCAYLFMHVIHDNVYICSCMSLPSGKILCSLPRLVSQKSLRGDGHGQRRRSSSFGVEFSDFLDKSFFMHPCLECRVGTIPHCNISNRNCWEGDSTYTAGSVGVHGKVKEPF